MNGPLVVGLSAAYTNVGMGYAVAFTAQIQGRTTASRWEFGDGTVVSNRPYASHAWVAVGDYVVVLRAFNEDQPAGVTATLVVRVTVPVHYVSAMGLNPVAPYVTWATAATNIQDAVDAAVPGDTVWVTNGVYTTGGRAVSGLMTNRVAVTNPVLLESVNGPAVTVIAGWQVPGVTNGPCGRAGVPLPQVAAME